MKKIFYILPLLAMSLLLSGCSLYSNSKAPSSQPVSAVPTTSNTISIQNFAFNPSVLTVKRGSVVTWANNDSAPHQIKSKTFNSRSLSKGESFSFTFNEAGTFDYICSIHPSMTGRIVVE